MRFSLFCIGIIKCYRCTVTVVSLYAQEFKVLLLKVIIFVREILSGFVSLSAQRTTLLGVVGSSHFADILLIININ